MCCFLSRLQGTQPGVLTLVKRQYVCIMQPMMMRCTSSNDDKYNTDRTSVHDQVTCNMLSTLCLAAQHKAKQWALGRQVNMHSKTKSTTLDKDTNTDQSLNEATLKLCILLITCMCSRWSMKAHTFAIEAADLEDERFVLQLEGLPILAATGHSFVKRPSRRGRRCLESRLQAKPCHAVDFLPANRRVGAAAQSIQVSKYTGLLTGLYASN